MKSKVNVLIAGMQSVRQAGSRQAWWQDDNMYGQQYSVWPSWGDQGGDIISDASHHLAASPTLAFRVSTLNTEKQYKEGGVSGGQSYHHLDFSTFIKISFFQIFCPVRPGERVMKLLLLYHLTVPPSVPSVGRPSLVIARYLAGRDCKEVAHIVKISNHDRPSLPSQPRDHFHISQNWSNLFLCPSDKEVWPLVVSKNRPC